MPAARPETPEPLETCTDSSSGADASSVMSGAGAGVVSFLSPDVRSSPGSGWSSMMAWKIALMSSSRGISLPQSLVPAVGTVMKVTAPASTLRSDCPSVSSDRVSTPSTNVARVKALMKPLSLPDRTAPARHRLAQQRRQEQLLPLDPAVVAVALGLHVAGTDVVEGLATVQRLVAGDGQDVAEFTVDQRLRDAHVHAADRVDHALEAREVHADEVLDLQSDIFWMTFTRHFGPPSA